MINLKSLKRYSISLLLLNYNNTYCGCLCNDKDKKNTNDSNSGNNNNNDNKTTNQEEIEKRNKDVIDYLLKLFNDKKAKLTELNRENELKITEQQIKDIKDQSQVNNIIEELNKLEIEYNPAANVVLDPDNIPNEPYIIKYNCNEIDKSNIFFKYINKDININFSTTGNEEEVKTKQKKIIQNLLKENKLFYFLKHDLLFFDTKKNAEYFKNNCYYLYIDKNTFRLKDGIKLGDFKIKDFKNYLSVNPKKFENCYLLFNDLLNEENIITVFKKKTIIDLDKLDSYPNIFCFIQGEENEKTISRFKEFVKKLNNIEVKDNKLLGDFYESNAINVKTKYKEFGIFNSTIDEIEFKGYKKLTEKPTSYDDIDEKEKFEIQKMISDGTITTYYCVKE